MTRPKKPPKPRARSGKHLHAGVLVRAPDAEREAWARVAAALGLTRVDWLRQLANDAVLYFDQYAPKKKDRAKKG